MESDIIPERLENTGSVQDHRSASLVTANAVPRRAHFGVVFNSACGSVIHGINVLAFDVGATEPTDWHLKILTSTVSQLLPATNPGVT
jgi:hypothetical protein